MRYHHSFNVARASQAALVLIRSLPCKACPAAFPPHSITRALFTSRTSLDSNHSVRHFRADICSRVSVKVFSQKGGRFRMSSTDAISLPQSKESFAFGPYRIGVEEVFLTTKLSYAFVNLRPVVPALDLIVLLDKSKHVLVCPIREVRRYTDLSSDEVTDLWLAAQRIGAKLEPFFEASSLTLAIQDGPEAGQTVPHVHIHILPRKKADFKNNDDIYDELNKKEEELADNLNLDQERKDRTPQEMHEEASKLRALF